MFPCFGVLAIIAVMAALVVPWIVASSRRSDEAWATAARQLGLHFAPARLFKPRRIEGTFQGQHVVVDTFTRSSGKHSQSYTRYRVLYPRPLGLGLRLTQQGIFSGIASFFGAQDIELGDRAFDGAVVVKGADPRRVAAFLTPSRRLRAQRLLTSLAGAEVHDGEIHWSARGVAGDAQRIVSVVRRMSDLAQHLCQDLAEDQAVDQVIEAQLVGELDTALERVRTLPKTADAGRLDMDLLEGEILYTGRRYQEASELFENARRQAPDDAEVAGWAEQAARKLQSAAAVSTSDAIPVAGQPSATAPAAQPPSSAPAAPAPAVDSATSAAAVCEELFNPRHLSFETNELFETRWQGQRVLWSGTLRRVSPFSFDLVFGREAAAKAVVEIHELAGFGGRKVQAVVQLPADADDALRDRLGEQVTFSGRLVSCDALMRNVFVADGAL